jgi:hypothetical protein
MSAKRRWVIGQATDPETDEELGFYDREQLLACMEEIEHLLYMVGGMVAFTTERVEVDQLGGEPLAVSRRVIVDWTAFSPMVREQRTERVEEPDVMPPETGDALDDEMDGAPLEDDEDEDIDRSLTTVGDPRPDATL